MGMNSVFVRPAEMIGGGIFHCEESHPFRFQLHKHDHISELLLIEKGEGEFSIDGGVYYAVPGTLLFYQRGVWHEERSTVHPFAGLYIAFRGLALKELPTDHLLPAGDPPVLQLGDQAAPFVDSFKMCIGEYESNEPEAGTAASHMLGILLARLARLLHYRNAQAAASKPSRQAVLTARRYIEENYNQPVTLERLARVTFVNPYYLAHLFKEEMGVSPIHYLILCRMEAAKRYLSISGYSVRQIGELVGYQSETSFQSMFKKVTGVTPGDYRKNRV